VYPPGGQPGVAGFAICYSGSPSQADRALAPLRALGRPIVDDVAPIDYVALQKSGDTDDFRAQAAYLKSGFVTQVAPGLIDVIVDGLEPHPGRLTQMVFVQGLGAIERVPNSATAFSQRDKFANLLGIVGWPYPSDGSMHANWIRNYWPSVEPYLSGFYTNDLEPDHAVQVINENYGENYDRLVRIKDRYDPTNLFRLNANIEPSV